jgi:flagellar basal-body rod protein FlgF
MGGIIEFAEAILSRANRRTEVAAQNITNLTTPGYKARIPFEQLVSSSSTVNLSDPPQGGVTDWSAGKIVPTHNPLDLAISGDGFFVVKSGDQTFYTRGGSFQRGPDGSIVTADGMILQTTGGDAVVNDASFTIDDKGVITDGGKDVGQVALVDFTDRSQLSAVGNSRYQASASLAHTIDDSRIVQGALEQSNASDATEMLTMMASLRSAESGQRVAQLYDDLMAMAATGFGQGQG